MALRKVIKLGGATLSATFDLVNCPIKEMRVLTDSSNVILSSLANASNVVIGTAFGQWIYHDFTLNPTDTFTIVSGNATIMIWDYTDA